MTCMEKGCVFPVLRANLCIQHLRQREEGTRLNLRTEVRPVVKEQRKEAVPLAVTTSKIARDENGWTWEYISESEAEIWKALAPVWGWLYKALESLPKGQCAKLKVPEGQDLKTVRRKIGGRVRAQFKYHRWRVRTGHDLKHVIVMQNGTWKEWTEKRQREQGTLV